MAQKSHPSIIRPFKTEYQNSVYWDEPRFHYITTNIKQLIESCCLETNHYLNNIAICKSSESLILNIDLIHLHSNSKKKIIYRRRKENEKTNTVASWPIVACRLTKATQLIQRFSGTKKVALKIRRTKAYTRSIPKLARKELIFYTKGFNKTRYDYARHGMQLMYLITNNKAHVRTLSRFILQNICSRQKRKRHYQFLNYLKQSLKSLETSKSIKGIKIQIKGRFTHKAKGRSQKWKFQIGSMPLSSIRENIQAEYTQTQTAYGSVGLKIWICH